MVGISKGDAPASRGPALLTALIIGSARTLADDERRARELFTPDLLIGCNHAARDHDGPVDHWATMHPDLYPLWLSLRRQAGRPEPGQLWHARHRIAPPGLATRPIASWGGSSGLLCVAVAFELGVERIVLAGVPLDKMARHYDDDRPWQEARAYRHMWEMRVPMLTGRVKSMSGWTCDLLGGEPTEEWLGDEHRAAAGTP